jgi:hypothetical protein
VSARHPVSGQFMPGDQGQALMAHKEAQEAAFAAMVPPAPDRPAASPQPVSFPGAADPGGRDIVAADPAGAVANTEARYGELQSDTYGQGSTIGDVLALAEVPDAHSKHIGGDDAGYPA